MENDQTMYIDRALAREVKLGQLNDLRTSIRHTERVLDFLRDTFYQRQNEFALEFPIPEPPDWFKLRIDSAYSLQEGTHAGEITN